jgi:hypothetical protein
MAARVPDVRPDGDEAGREVEGYNARAATSNSSKSGTSPVS